MTVHARTRKEMSKVPAKWDRVKRAVEIRNDLQSEALIIGNGDAVNLEDARDKVKSSRADGAMLGRAVFGNPWLFHPEKDASNISLEERLGVMVEHTKLFVELLPHKNFSVMKKHYKAYVNDFPDASHLRNRLMSANTPDEVESLVHAFLEKDSSKLSQVDTL